MGKIGPGVASSSLHSQSSFPALGSTRGGSVGFLTHQSRSALFYSGAFITSRNFGVECNQQSVEVSGKLCIYSSIINSSSVVQVSNRTCHHTIQTSYSSGTMLDRGFLPSHSSQHVKRCFSSASHYKGSCHRCVSRLVAQGCTIAALTLWLLWYMCCVDKGSLL